MNSWVKHLTLQLAIVYRCSSLAGGSQFTCVPLLILLCPGISCVASAPCQYPCWLVLGHTHAHTRHQAAGWRQLCSLKGKVNSCARDSWSSHDIPSPNISDGFGRNGASAREGPIYNLDEAPRLQPETTLDQELLFFFSFFSSSHICGDNVWSNEFLLGL